MSHEFPPLTIVMTVYFPEEIAGKRIMAALQTLESWQHYLQYSGDINLHVADDGSMLQLGLNKLWKRGKVSHSRQIRGGVGTSLNKGFKIAFMSSPLVMYAVDDWSLVEHFNLDPWAYLLLNREDVGMVRLGPPHPGTCGTIEAFTDRWQGWGLRLKRYGFAYAQRPALYHQRFYKAYGEFDENMSAIECEKLYMDRIVKYPGPDIVLALPHPWQHLDTVSLSALQPEKDG